MREIGVPNFFEDRGNLYSLSRDGKSIYGEQVTSRGGKSYRIFSPLRSKLSSSIKLGLKPEILKDDHILYLGAGAGTTVSHLADSTSSGMVFAIEMSPSPFIKLMSLSRIKDNVYPVLADAQRPEMYGLFLDKVDSIYQDVSQPNQIEIFIKNMEYFNSKKGILMLKTFSLRSDFSVDREINKLKNNFNVRQAKDISRFHKGHYAVVVSTN